MSHMILIVLTVQIEADPDAGDDRESRLFPDKGTGLHITCAALTSDFLIFGTEVHMDIHSYIHTYYILLLVILSSISSAVW